MKRLMFIVFIITTITACGVKGPLSRDLAMTKNQKLKNMTNKKTSSSWSI